MVSRFESGIYSSERRFRFTSFLLNFGGISLLSKNISLLQRGYNLLVSMSTYLLYVTSFADICMNSDDMNRITTTLRLYFQMILVLWIEINIRYRADTLWRLLLMTESFIWEDMPLTDPETGEITIAGWVQRMDKFLKRAVPAGFVIHTTQTLIRIFTIHELVFQSWFPFNVYVSPMYEIVVFTQMLATNRIIGIYAAVLQAYTLIVCIACTQLHKVKESLEGINRKEFKSVSDLNEKETGEMQDELNKTVRHHQLIISYIWTLEDFMSSMMAGVLLLTMLSLCTAAFTAVMNFGNVTDMTQSALIYALCIITAFVYCWFGSLLSEMFESVSEGAWDSDWVGISIPYQRCISFIIAISNKGFKLTAGKFIPVSNSTLMNMLNESLSLFMFLLTMKDKNEDIK